jgi:GGDEF domain-containing protein
MPLKLSLGRFSLADKISMTIIALGIFGIFLVYYISISYKQFAYQHHTQSIQQLAYLEINDLVEDLKTHSIDLALAIELESDFKGSLRYKRKEDLTQQLNNQFNQYFVTAGIIKLFKLYILDTDFTLLSTSTEGVSTDQDDDLICHQLSQSALKRQGPEKLKPLSDMCLYKNHSVFSVIVPLGGLNPKGYIQIITDLAYKLKKVEQSMAMPIQINSLNGQLIYQSKDWLLTPDNKNYLNIDLPILSDNNKPVMTISLKSDMTTFNKEITEHRNRIMSLSLVTTAVTVIFVLLVLRRSTIPSLAKIHDVLEKIHLSSYSDNKKGRILFEQLLEQIIQLRQKNKTGFSVMILDLTHFKQVNQDYSEAIGDELLLKVEQRLCSILRNSDLISWVGTDTPGHKLLPSGSRTQYRATIARLGGDEFGLLLPSAENEEQANTVAQRIVETLNKSFHIKDHNINIECRIGISIYPIHGDDEKILIRNADKAMYKAKELNQTVFIFEP